MFYVLAGYTSPHNLFPPNHGPSRRRRTQYCCRQIYPAARPGTEAPRQEAHYAYREETLATPQESRPSANPGTPSTQTDPSPQAQSGMNTKRFS